ncbi:winged helix-turn-helix domain-containing protein [Caballeronia concitans]|uniref:Two-component response regulator n=1 Tax=Caballeronia concitans TaxID=1777133 RepID=A0A658R552_9BURK|nr:winged helix-turn-helix domain-containing protein [Caballeronia concitans]SAL51686.1 two-component response regulator [Caballeronia concitans]
MRLLLIADDEQIAETIATALRSMGYIVDCADHSRCSGCSLDNNRPYDLVLIDASHQKARWRDSLTNCRGRNAAVPIIILTEDDEFQSSVSDAAADDYLVKPFDLYQLAATVQSLLRRNGPRLCPWRHGELELDVASHEVKRADVTLDVTPLEFNLLALLMEAPTRVLRRDELHAKLLEWGCDTSSSTVEQLIEDARSKIGAEEIVTVRGVGYRLKAGRQATLRL